MPIKTETLGYSADGTSLKGHLAFDSGVEGPRPGVLVIHEWWGLNDYIRERAELLAGLGYTALAIDMYGDGKIAANPDEAGALMNGVLNDMTAGTTRLRAAHAALQGHAACDGNRMAAIGFCFGGAMSLHMARIGMPLNAVVSFHGSLGSFHKPSAGEVKARVLVCHGEADEFIPAQEVADFKAEMESAKVDYRFESYAGAKHGFSSREADDNGAKYGLPLAYDEAADRQSWASMQALFKEVF